MGRAPCCEKMGLTKGPWTPEEDQILINYIKLYGHGNWRALPKQASKFLFYKNGSNFDNLDLFQDLHQAYDFFLWSNFDYLGFDLLLFSFLILFPGLLRCGKSCRLRWTNYLRPDIKRGNFTREEEDTIINLHEMLGNRCVLFEFLCSLKLKVLLYLTFSFIIP